MFHTTKCFHASSCSEAFVRIAKNIPVSRLTLQIILVADKYKYNIVGQFNNEET